MHNFSKLRGAVAGKGYTLQALAEELEITQQGLNEKLHGRSQFTLVEMIKTCNFLDAPVNIFFDIECIKEGHLELEGQEAPDQSTLPAQ